MYTDEAQAFLIKLEIHAEEFDECPEETLVQHPAVKFRLLPCNSMLHRSYFSLQTKSSAASLVANSYLS